MLGFSLLLVLFCYRLEWYLQVCCCMSEMASILFVCGLRPRHAVTFFASYLAIAGDDEKAVAGGSSGFDLE